MASEAWFWAPLPMLSRLPPPPQPLCPPRQATKPLRSALACTAQHAAARTVRVGEGEQRFAMPLRSRLKPGCGEVPFATLGSSETRDGAQAGGGLAVEGGVRTALALARAHLLTDPGSVEVGNVARGRSAACHASSDGWRAATDGDIGSHPRPQLRGAAAAAARLKASACRHAWRQRYGAAHRSHHRRERARVLEADAPASAAARALNRRKHGLDA
eukprot:6189596-Pleurochrysis_carterae.AAC.3